MRPLFLPPGIRISWRSRHFWTLNDNKRVVFIHCTVSDKLLRVMVDLGTRLLRTRKALKLVVAIPRDRIRVQKSCGYVV